MQSKKNPFLMNNCFLENITLNGGSLFSSQNYLYLKDTFIKNVFAINKYLIEITNSSINIENLNVHNCSNGIIYLENANIILRNTIFDNSLANKTLDFIAKSCIKLIENIKNMTSKIENVTFHGMNSDNGSALNCENYAGVLFLSKIELIDNQAYLYGGAIYSYQSNLIVYKCLFKSNIAKYGGAIYYDNDEKSHLTMILYNNSFELNQADEGGGIRIIKKIPKFIINSNKFHGNKAHSYGDNYASEPYRVIFSKNESYLKDETVFDLLNNKKKNFQSLKVIPGESLPISLNFAILDVFNQKAKKHFNKY